MFMLDDANASKNIHDAISLCQHGACSKRRSCDIRDAVIGNCEELGIFTPITGCSEYCHDVAGELTFDFD